MSNNFFQFKQFTIHQDRCAMKVCTDACLFGSIIASDEGQYKSVIDIGSGTGLLSLMYAQKNPASIIQAVEIDPAAAEQALENFKASKWKDRIDIINEDVSRIVFAEKYDLVISNPPFYEDDLQSDNPHKNAAKHNTTLDLKRLLIIGSEILNENGKLAVLIPGHRIDFFENEAVSNGFHLCRKLLIRQSPAHAVFRGILFFKKEKSDPLVTEMSIRRTDGHYTAEFVSLLKDYYLYL